MTDRLEIRDISEGCLVCLHYFGIFRFPLSAEQVYHFTPFPASPEQISSTLEKLIQDKKAFRLDDYYMIDDQPGWITLRREGESRAKNLLKRSYKFVRIIASFPFVRGVAISGSLSKYYASEKPDIDYFIITDLNRLWIARSLLHLFKKFTFITGHQHYYCMNYFIDTAALNIEHPNLYSAIETKTLLPVYNAGLLEEFHNENTWADTYLPNHPGSRDFQYLIRNRKRPLKKLFELLISLLFPNTLNKWLMKVTDNKWRRKWARSGYDMSQYDFAFRTGIHISKNHPTDYQKKVLESLPGNLKKPAE